MRPVRWARSASAIALTILAVSGRLGIFAAPPVRPAAPVPEAKLYEEDLKKGQLAAKAREQQQRAVQTTAPAPKTAAEVPATAASTGATLMAPALQVRTGADAPAVNYLMAHVDRQRTGWNPNETLLTPANVTINNTVSSAHNFNTPTAGFFGEIWNSPQFANAPDCWATTLYVDSVTLTSSPSLINPAYAGNTFSVAYCGTGKCDVYAVCASGAIVGSTIVPPGTILWRKNLGSPAVGIDGTNVGIFGTPIIDLNATPPTMYVSVCPSPQVGWSIYAIDITNGTVLPNWPVVIKNATVQLVMQNGGANPPLFLDSSGLRDACRGALNLSADGTTLFVPISDVSSETGFMVTVATNGTPHVASCFSGVANPPDIGQGHGVGNFYAGMWSPTGASLDGAGNCYVCTGDCPNGGPLFTPDLDRQPGWWGMTMLVFNPPTAVNPALALHGTYNAWNYQSMDSNDVDIASTPIIIPDLPGPVPHTTAYGAKNGNLYFVNRDGLNTTTVATNMRPAAVNGTPFQSNKDETGLVSPFPYSYYTNNGATPGGATGPLNVFGPYTEGSNGTNLAKARTSAAVFQGPDSNYYLVYTGSTKIASGQQAVLPPCVARIKINTFASSNPYLTIDGTENTQVFESAGSAVISSNGNQNAITWMLDANRYRLGGLSGSHPYLVGVEAMTMKTLYKSAVSATNTDSTNGGPPSTLHQGGKYNEPSVARGKVFVGTDRLQAFGVTSYVYAIGAGGSGGAGDMTTTLSPVLPTTVVGTSPDGKRNITTTTVGKTYTADAFFTGGTPSAGTGNTIDVSTVSNPAPAAVYQHARIGVTGSGTPTGGFTYTFPNLIPGATYSVRLHFCETIVTASNQRRFNVSINGTQVLTNYDIFATASARFIACEEPFAAIADPTTGTITVAFSPGTVSVPMVSAIEVNSLPTSLTQEYFFDWQAQYGLIGTLGNATADSSGDGIPNAWKYFTGANPTQHGNPTALLPNFSEITTGGANYLQFTYLRRIDYAARGFSIVVQTSPDLSPGSWTAQPAGQVGSAIPTGDGVTETAVIRLTSPVPAGSNKLFARVQLTLAN